MAVPFIDLRRLEPGFLEAWAERSMALSREARFVGGPDVTALEERLAALAGCPAVVACANGTDALQLALRAVGVGPGDIVLVPDATFWATFEAVVNVGARVVTVDINRHDLQMDLEAFRDAVRRFTPRAAVLVHLYGWGTAELEAFRAHCREISLPLVEDGAQAFGVTWRGASVYRDAEIATVSFYPAKVLGACGDAGAVFCGRSELADTVRLLGNHGRVSHYEHGLVGWNSRMGGLEAAYLDLALDYLEDRLASRRSAARRYREALGRVGVLAAAPPDGFEENGYLNVTLTEPSRRAVVQAALRRHGIGFGTVYPGAMSEQPGAKGHLLAHVGGDTAAWLGRSVLNLPLFAYLRDEEVDAAVAVVSEAWTGVERDGRGGGGA